MADKMNDPAVEAARKADTRENGEPVYWSTTRDAMVAAADEADAVHSWESPDTDWIGEELPNVVRC